MRLLHRVTSNSLVERFTHVYFTPLCNSQGVISVFMSKVFQKIVELLSSPQISLTKIVSDNMEISKTFFLSLPIVQSTLGNDETHPRTSLLRISFGTGFHTDPKTMIEIIRFLPLLPEDKLLSFEITPENRENPQEQEIRFEKMPFAAILGNIPLNDKITQNTVHIKEHKEFQNTCCTQSVPPYYAAQARSFIKSHPPGSFFIAFSPMSCTDSIPPLISKPDYNKIIQFLLEISPKIIIIVFDPGYKFDLQSNQQSRILSSKQFGWSIIQEIAFIASSDYYIGNSNIYGTAANQFNIKGLIFFEDQNIWQELHNPDDASIINGNILNKNVLTGFISRYL